MSRFKTRARMRARNAELRAAANLPPKSRAAAGGRETARSEPRAGLESSGWRIAMNVALLFVSLGGAALQLIEASRKIPGEHRLWLSVYLFIAVFAAYSLSARLKKRRDVKNGVVPKTRRATGAR